MSALPLSRVSRSLLLLIGLSGVHSFGMSTVPRSLLLLVGLSSVHGFGTAPGDGIDTEGTKKKKNDAWPWEGMNPVLSDWPTDVCSNLLGLDIIDGGLCNQRKTADSCVIHKLFRTGGERMTEAGMTRAYDVCAWDPNARNGKGKCRAAPVSYLCKSGSPGCPGVKATRSTDPDIMRVEKCQKAVYRGKGSDPVQNTEPIDYCTISLIDTSRRRALTEHENVIEGREPRQLQNPGDCVQGWTYLPQATGEDVKCCDGQTSKILEYTRDVSANGQTFDTWFVLETCVVNGNACDCTTRQEQQGSTSDSECLDGAPFRW